MRVVVLAKAPTAGVSKTRLQARWEPQQVALIAEAALADTLGTVSRLSGVHLELVLDGAPGPWLPAGFHVRPQVAGDLATRLCAALAGSRLPTVLVGMDTPQLRLAHLELGLEQLADADATLGPAEDGGWWALGLAAPVRHAHLVLGVPTSTHLTGRLQQARLDRAGLVTAALPTLRDVDLPEDADHVADLIPDSRYGTLVRSLRLPA